MNRSKSLCNRNRKNGTKKWVAVLVTAGITFLPFGCKDLQEENVTPEDTPNVAVETEIQQPQNPADKTLLAGSWIRTDAEYRIDISELFDNGKMKVQYYNPKTINVSEARWSIEEEMMKVFIELRDINYPGSNYNLTYIPVRDILVGEYYQAVEGSTYKVEFKRAK